MGTPAEPQSLTGEITSPQDSGINPAWNDALSGIPEQYHAALTPHFQKWDSEAQGRITDLNSKVSSWEDYNFLKEHGITAQQVNQALNIMQEINTNPRTIYDALAEAYKYNEQPNTNPQGLVNPEDTNPWEAKYNELQGQIGSLSQIMLQQEEVKRNQAADVQLDSEINAAMQKFPDVVMDPATENYILTQAYNGKSIEQAFQQFVDFRNSLGPQPHSPMIIGSQGGGVPSQQVDPRKLSGKDTRSLVVQMLEANQRANRT